MTKEPYDTKEQTTAQTKKWQLAFPILDITPIFADTDLDVKQFDNVLILFHAIWSGPSISNLSKILERVNQYRPTLKIFVIDIDSVSLDYIKSILGHQSHGHGEAIYIENGQVKGKCREQLDQSEFNKFIENLKS